MSALRLLLTLAALLCAAPALAATVVLHGDGVDPDAAKSRAAKVLDGDLLLEGPASAVVEIPDDQLVIIGSTALRCPKEPYDGKPLAGELLVAREAAINLDYVAASQTLDALVSGLPCRALTATSDELWEVFFLQGFLHFAEGREGDARIAFTKAAAIDATRQWSSTYPPTAKDTYLEALQRALTRKGPDLQVHADDASIDGRPPGEDVDLLAGGHLVVRGDEAIWLEVGAGGAPIVVTTGALIKEKLLAGDQAYAPWFATVARARGWEDVLLVGEEGAVRFLGGAFQPVDEDVRRRADVNPGAVAGAVMLGVGGGTLGLGLGLNISGYQAGTVLDGEPLLPAGEYEAARSRGVAGLAIAIAGGAVAGAGLAIAIASSSKPKVKAKAKPVVAVPWVVGSEQGVAFGVSGVFGARRPKPTAD
jgi:hypothetical protein